MIDFALREVTLDGQPVKLTPTEYHLVRNEGIVMPQSLLLQQVGARDTSTQVPQEMYPAAQRETEG